MTAAKAITNCLLIGVVLGILLGLAADALSYDNRWTHIESKWERNHNHMERWKK